MTDINALVCAKVSYWLGGGRTRADGPIDHAVGLQLYVELGDYITKGKLNMLLLMFSLLFQYLFLCELCPLNVYIKIHACVVHQSYFELSL